MNEFPTARDIEAILRTLCGCDLSPDEGLKFGIANRRVTGMVNCWTFNQEVVDVAKREGCNLILSHEALYVPYGVTEGQPMGAGSDCYLTWPANHSRTISLVENDLSFIRFHGHADQVTVFRAFADQLGLAQVHAAGPLGYDAVYEHAPLTIEDWVERVKQKTGMGGLRTAIHDPHRKVTRIGLAWGGMGLFVNIAYPMALVELGAELIIAGETDNYGFRFMHESGVDVIETSHEISENQGIEQVGDLMRRELPDLKVVDCLNPCIWQWR